jgi:hypothetical protein
MPTEILATKTETIMIEAVVALLMFYNGEIKEHRIQDSMAACLRGKRQAERQYSESVSYKCYKGKAETEIYMGEKSIKKIILN